VMVPDKDSQREAKAKREAVKTSGLSASRSGPAGYREVGCGTVTLYDEEARRLDTVRYGRAPEYKKHTLTDQLDAELESILAVRPDLGPLGKLLSHLSQSRHHRMRLSGVPRVSLRHLIIVRSLEVVAIADGAEENWRSFDRPLYTEATRIVDHGHACDHLRAAMTAYDGDQSVEGRAAYARLRSIVRDQPGGVDEGITELGRLARKLGGQRRKARRKRLRRELTYFQNQRDRMDDAA
jgi:hypothetical protein